MLCDQYHDPAHAMLYTLLSERPDAAEFVKHAELDAEDTEKLADSMFAWPERRMFPINTPENTVLSSLFREKCAAVPAEVDEQLAKAREIYEVDAVLQNRVKIAAAPKEHVLLPSLGRLRVKTAEDVPVAEKLLLRDYPNLNIEDRAEGFTNLVKVAQDMGVELQPETHRMAGMTVCTTKVAMDFIEARRCATKEPLFQTAYVKLAQALRASGKTHIQDRDTLIDLANTVAKLDKEAGLAMHYDRDLPDPIRTVFNTTKLAEESFDIAGRDIALSKLAAMPATFWEDLAGPEMSREVLDKTGSAVDVEKLRQVIPTLPLDLKVILRGQIP